MSGLADRSEHGNVHGRVEVDGAPPPHPTRWRTTTAGRLLHESPTPLGTVGQQIGYASEFAFSKAFEREFGMAPGRCRLAAGATRAPAASGRGPRTTGRAPRADLTGAA
ncbi:hypothetical protein ACIBSV_08750 [Embleya sp. NPDC050154]|uniref:hypothetical protein n=1 Tax=Embleya sp. NPDC050154 TaxID=3363988 RepID=UPI00378D7A79